MVGLWWVCLPFSREQTSLLTLPVQLTWYRGYNELVCRSEKCTDGPSHNTNSKRVHLILGQSQKCTHWSISCEWKPLLFLFYPVSTFSIKPHVQSSGSCMYLVFATLLACSLFPLIAGPACLWLVYAVT